MSTWEDSGLHVDEDRWRQEPFRAVRRNRWWKSGVGQQIALRVAALAGLVGGVGMVITSEALTFKPGDGPRPAEQSMVLAQSDADAYAAERTSGFTKAALVDLDEMKALAKLQAAARRAAEVGQQQASLAPAVAPEPSGVSPAPATADQAGEAAPPLQPESTASIAESPPSDAASFDSFDPPAAIGDANALSAELTAEPATDAALSEGAELAMLPRVPAPRPDPPAATVRKSSASASSRPPNCGAKHAYYRSVNRKKVWYCR